jgi:hypothetical protein
MSLIQWTQNQKEKRKYGNVKVQFKHIQLVVQEVVEQLIGTPQCWQLANFLSANIMNSKEF